MAYVKVGYWCKYTILSRHPVTEDDIHFSTNFELRLMQNMHVQGSVIEHVIDSVDVVYPEFFHYQHESESYSYYIGEWNDIKIFAHLDDIQLMDVKTVSLILFLARSG